jgi:hypothetical protein
VPGGKSLAIVNFEPGTYVLMCAIRDKNNVPTSRMA